MRYNYALPALALAGSAFAAPAVVTETSVVYVTAAPSTASAAASASHAPQVGAVYEVVVSKLVEIKAETTETHTTTFTRTKDVETESATPSSTSTATPAAETTEAAPSPIETTTSSPAAVEAAAVETTSAAPTTTSTKETTTLAPTTTSSTAAAPTTTSSTAAAATTSASSSTDSSFASAILAEHNAKRALHGVSDLEWSSTLASYAQAYADAYDCSGTLTHSGGPYGENLGLGYTTTGVVDAWYNEISDYSYSSPSASHFTQVVWKATTQLGCGYTSCGSYWGQYTICSYEVPGNVAGEYADNVLPLV